MSLQPKLWSQPARRQLPSWSRPGLSKRSLNVGTLARDVAPIHAGPEFHVHESPSRVKQLEKNVIFLKQQHRETLQQLHEEIERLKNVNRGEGDSLSLTLCRMVQHSVLTSLRVFGRRGSLLLLSAFQWGSRTPPHQCVYSLHRHCHIFSHHPQLCPSSINNDVFLLDLLS